MEPFLFSLLVAWGLVRYGVTDLVATARGTESPRYRERRQRLALQHERKMARLQTGPTIGQAVASRIAHRIAHPKPPRDRSGQTPFRRFMGDWWEDSWNYATERRLRHHERKQTGDLPRQKAARATKDAFDRWRTERRHRHTSTAAPTGGAVPPETATERTGPIHVAAERLLPAETSTAPATEPLPDLGGVVEYPDDQDPQETAVSEERNSTPMNTQNDATPTGEVTNISSALDYTRGMGEQFDAAVAHSEALAAQAAQMSGWSAQASATAETAVAGITSGEVTGEAVDRLQAAHEQMTAAADCAQRAAEALQLAQEQFAATAEGFAAARAAFERQQTVAEAYAANPDAGSKQFNTYA
ncbi:MAG: hypothetical protein GEU86_21165 [Actinophytocola sp.]|nr:hypothetical protein [Actinophytocola sp.]